MSCASRFSERLVVSDGDERIAQQAFVARRIVRIVRHDARLDGVPVAPECIGMVRRVADGTRFRAFSR